MANETQSYAAAPVFMGQQEAPFSMEAEQAVLGSVLLDPECFAGVRVILKAECFHLPQHREVFSVLIELDTIGQKIDPLLVADKLTAAGSFDVSGGRQYVLQLAQMVPSAANVEAYAQIVREKFYLRALMTAAQGMLEHAAAQSESADEILDAAEQRIYEIRQGRVTGGPTLLRDILVNEVYETFARLTSAESEEYKGFSSGYQELDNVLSGINRSDLILLGARPAMGKTSVALRLARNIAVHNRKRVLFFTLEMTKEQVAQRILSMEALVPGHRMRSGLFEPGDWEKLGNAVADLNSCELYFDDTAVLTVSEMKARARRLKGVDCIVVDYLGLISGGKRTENRVQEVSEITRSLKMMAKDLNIPIICAAQLSRATEGRGKSHRPQLSDLRESGSIEQDADIVLLLYRENYYQSEKDDAAVAELPESNDMEIIVAKNRHGFTKTVEFIWDADHTLILPKETNYD